MRADLVGQASLGSRWRMLLAAVFIAALYAHPAVDLEISPSTVKHGESFRAIFSGQDVTEEMSFDVYYREPGDDHDRLRHWQDGRTAVHEVEARIFPGTWRITGIKMHRKSADCPVRTENFARVDVRVNVSWPLREKVLVALIVVLEIFVWSSFPRWLRE